VSLAAASLILACVVCFCIFIAVTYINFPTNSPFLCKANVGKPRCPNLAILRVLSPTVRRMSRESDFVDMTLHYIIGDHQPPATKLQGTARSLNAGFVIPVNPKLHKFLQPKDKPPPPSISQFPPHLSSLSPFLFLFLFHPTQAHLPSNRNN